MKVDGIREEKRVRYFIDGGGRGDPENTRRKDTSPVKGLAPGLEQ